MRAPGGHGNERGQATVELVAVLPVLILLALVALQFAVAGFGLWTSANASRAAARAEHVGAGVREVARSAVPLPLRHRLEVGHDPVSVSLRVPGLLPKLPPVRVHARTSLDGAEGG